MPLVWPPVFPPPLPLLCDPPEAPVAEPLVLVPAVGREVDWLPLPVVPPLPLHPTASAARQSAIPTGATSRPLTRFLQSLKGGDLERILARDAAAP